MIQIQFGLLSVVTQLVQKYMNQQTVVRIWTNISAGLPNLPVMCIVHYKIATDRNVLFVGTDLGVYVKDGTNNWAAYNTGLPNVVVTELEIFYTGGSR